MNKDEQKHLLIEMMREDEKSGMYDPDEKIEVYNFTYLGQTVVFRSKESLIDWISDEVGYMDIDNDPEEMIISKRMMREGDIRVLKEFEGY